MNRARITRLQAEAARLFFSLPQSAGFAVAGGAALLVRDLIQRPTQDIDLFLVDASSSSVTAAAGALEHAMDRTGWSHQRVIDQQDFVRFQVSDNAEVLIIDIGRDSPADEPVSDTDIGPTLSARDLAARKLLALFGRAEARDFTDVYALAHRYGRDQLLRWAAAADAGFDKQVFADMLISLERLADEDLPAEASDVAGVRAYFRDWASELRRRDKP